MYDDRNLNRNSTTFVLLNEKGIKDVIPLIN